MNGQLDGAAHTTGPILLPLDGSPLAERVRPWASALARRRRAPLLLLRVVDPDVPPAVSLAAIAGASLYKAPPPRHFRDAACYLDAQAATLCATAPDLEVQTEVLVGDPARRILEAEVARAAQLVVLTTHGRTGLGRWIRGSVAEEVLRYGAVPILLIRPWDEVAAQPGIEHVGKRVLVPLDGSPLAEQVLPEAVRLAGSHADQGGGAEAGGSREPHPLPRVPGGCGWPVRAGALAGGRDGALVLVSVVESPVGPVSPSVDATAAAQQYLGRVAGQLRQQHGGVAVRTVVLTAADVAAAIAGQAAGGESDVIAMSTHGRGSMGRWLYGSVADRVAHIARVPVLLFRPRAAAKPDTTPPLAGASAAPAGAGEPAAPAAAR